MDAIFTTAALASAEKIIQRALDYDPATRMALAALAPQVLATKITEPQLSIYIVPCEEGVRLMGHYEGDITTQLQGSLPTLIALAASDRMNFKDAGVELFGSSVFLGEIKKILSQLDIDWEEILAQLFGDIIGHQGAELIRTKMRWSKDRFTNMQRLASEFITQESNSIPSKPELNYFYQQVDDIKLGVDRVEARIEQLLNRIQQRAAQ